MNDRLAAFLCRLAMSFEYIYSVVVRASRVQRPAFDTPIVRFYEILDRRDKEIDPKRILLLLSESIPAWLDDNSLTLSKCNFADQI